MTQPILTLRAGQRLWCSLPNRREVVGTLSGHYNMSADGLLCRKLVDVELRCTFNNVVKRLPHYWVAVDSTWLYDYEASEHYWRAQMEYNHNKGDNSFI